MNQKPGLDMNHESYWLFNRDPDFMVYEIISMVVFGSRKRWDRWHIIPQLAGKMPLIYHL